MKLLNLKTGEVISVTSHEEYIKIIRESRPEGCICPEWCLVCRPEYCSNHCGLCQVCWEHG